MALVAERAGEIVAVGRLSKSHGVESARIYLVVADVCQRLGLGRELLKRLLQFASEEKLKTLYAEVPFDSPGMIQLLDASGFVRRHDAATQRFIAQLKLAE